MSAPVLTSRIEEVASELEHEGRRLLTLAARLRTSAIPTDPAPVGRLLTADDG